MDDWRRAAFELAWRQHGGSGLGLGWSDVLALTPADRDWLVEATMDRRRDEARALERATRR